MSQTLLQGRFVTLRLLERSFFFEYLAQFSGDVQQLLHADQESERIYLENRLKKMEHGATLFYCIFDNETGELIGAIEVRDNREHSGQLYNWINERFWGGGRYQEAVALVARAYFQQTGSLFLSAHVDASNKRSYRALKKCGFADLGVRRGPYGKQYELVLRLRL